MTAERCALCSAPLQSHEDEICSECRDEIFDGREDEPDYDNPDYDGRYGDRSPFQ